MDFKEFNKLIMQVNADPSSDESTEAITALTDFYNNTQKAYEDLQGKYEQEHEGRKKLALRYAEQVTTEDVLSDEEIEEQKIKNINERLNERFN